MPERKTSLKPKKKKKKRHIEQVMDDSMALLEDAYVFGKFMREIKKM